MSTVRTGYTLLLGGLALCGCVGQHAQAADQPRVEDPSLPAAAGGTGRRPRVVVEVDSNPRGFQVADAAIVADSVPEIDVVPVPKGHAEAVIGDAEGFVGTPTRELLRKGSGLRWIQVHSGGVNQVLFPEMLASPAVLTDAKIIKGAAMADHAMALLLGLTRQLHWSVRAAGRQEWTQRDYAPVELQGRTALIIGLGGAGTQIAERAAAFGMHVIATDPKDVPYIRAVERVEKPDRLHALLPAADVVFIAAPSTRETRGLFSDREFALLRPGSYLVNISRGALVDTNALVRALESGRLAGAGLDVVTPEPLPRDHPLWRAPNVIITPHVAGSSEHGVERRRHLVIENARRFALGLQLRNVVDKQLGY
jgi:phosphoglycerate dehydrogenase-like enzyme